TAAAAATGTAAGAFGWSLPLASPELQPMTATAAASSAPTRNDGMNRRIMMDDSSKLRLRRACIGDRFLIERVPQSAGRLQRHAGSQSGERQVEDVCSEQIGVFSRREPLAEPEHGDAEEADQKRAHGDERIEGFGQLAGVDARLQQLDDVLFAFAREREPLVLAADSRNRLVEKHQREILGVLAAELVEPPEDGSHALDRRRGFQFRIVGDRRRIAEQPEAFFGERKEDVVLAREVAVN